MNHAGGLSQSMTISCSKVSTLDTAPAISQASSVGPSRRLAALMTTRAPGVRRSANAP